MLEIIILLEIYSFVSVILAGEGIRFLQYASEAIYGKNNQVSGIQFILN